MKARPVQRGKHISLVNEETGEKLQSVSEILAALPKDALINWAGSATADYAVDNWGESGCANCKTSGTGLSAMPVAARLSKISKGRYEARDAAANRGTEVHHYGERLMAGERVTVPPELVGYVDSYRRFMEEFDLHPIHVERPVYHSVYAFGGRLDVEGDVILPDTREFADVPRDGDGFSRGLFDAKTSKSGIFGETGLQLTGYRYADTMILESGEHVSRDLVDFTAGIHIRADGYEVVRVDSSPDVFREFRYLQQISRLAVLDKGAGLKALILGRIPPPLMAQYRLVEVPAEEGPGF